MNYDMMIPELMKRKKMKHRFFSFHSDYVRKHKITNEYMYDQIHIYTPVPLFFFLFSFIDFIFFNNVLHCHMMIPTGRLFFTLLFRWWITYLISNKYAHAYNYITRTRKIDV